MELLTCLWFDNGQARTAAEFYAKTFPNSAFAGVDKAPSDYPDGKEGSELVVHFTLLGQKFMGLNGGPRFKPNEAVSFCIETKDQAETDHYWNAIVGNGGEESMCGWCRDAWGFSWQVTPKRLNELSAHPNPEVGKRAFEAMMSMRKIDVSALDAAVADLL